MDHQRCVEPDGAERLRHLRDSLGELRVDERCAMATEDGVRLFLRGVVEDELRAGLGDALAEHSLRRRYELDPLLDLPLVAD